MNMKTDLRIRAKDIRKSLPICEISENLTKLVRNHPSYIESKNVMLFYPTKYEIDLRGLLEDDKNFYFPRVKDENLLICPYLVGDRLEKSCFNILEPCSEPVDTSVLDLIIVPALMVDKKGYRLGYGGGYYDRLLGKLSSSVKTICALPEELVIEKLPRDDFDIPVDFVVISF